MAAIVAAPGPLEQIGKLKGPQFGSKGVACLATDGAVIYAGCRDHAIRVYDARTHELLYALGAPACTSPPRRTYLRSRRPALADSARA